MISVLLLFTFQVLRRGNRWVWWDQQGLVLLDLNKHRLFKSAGSVCLRGLIGCNILKLYAQVVAMEREVGSQINGFLCWFWFDKCCKKFNVCIDILYLLTAIFCLLQNLPSNKMSDCLVSPIENI